ncbi:hypothetical protein BDV41DRAFT_243260 [Aspergillus transmontanensis]|uniref:Uncharacterized protein n=1 Tax=Aspergillus transmontanensis TaxID=1034304 RepID=A0A5N6VZX5_9EURO|nr:hypothetical protein BDV41DRAFT_243260 [Aspergillus transmontanensis]
MDLCNEVNAGSRIFLFFLSSFIFYSQIIPILFTFPILLIIYGMAVLKACECVSFWLVLRVFKGRFIFSCANGELVHVCFKTFHLLQNLWTIL